MRLGPSIIGAIVGGAVGIAIQVGVESGMGKEGAWLALVVGALTGLGARAMAGEFIKNASYMRGALAAVIGLAAIMGGSYAASAMIRKNSVESMAELPEQRLPPSDAASDPEEPEEDDSTSEDETDSDSEKSEGDTAGDEESTEGESGEEAVDDESETADDASEESTETSDAEAEATDEESSDSETSGDEAPAARSVPKVPIENYAGDPNRPKKEVPFSTTQAIFMGLGVFLAYEFARGGGKQEPKA